MANAALTKLISRPLTRRRCWRARVRAKRPSFATRPTRWPRTAISCWSTFRSSRPTAKLSGARRRRWPTSGWRAVAALLWLGTRATILTLRRVVSRTQDHPACGTESRAAGGFRARRAHHPASGLCGQSMAAQTDRGGLRLDEDHRRAAQNPLPRTRAGAVARLLGRRRLQPAANRALGPAPA